MKLRRLTLSEKVAGAFMVGVLYLAVIGAIAYQSVERLGETTARAERTNVILRTLQDVLSLVTGAETGSRGFVITGDAQYLEPYRTAEADAVTRLRALERLAEGDSAQRERLHRWLTPSLLS